MSAYESQAHDRHFTIASCASEVTMVPNWDRLCWSNFPPADDGSCYLLTICDYFTKWVEGIPTSDKTTATVSSHLYKVCVGYILPKSVLN